MPFLATGENDSLLPSTLFLPRAYAPFRCLIRHDALRSGVCKTARDHAFERKLTHDFLVGRIIGLRLDHFGHLLFCSGHNVLSFTGPNVQAQRRAAFWRVLWSAKKLGLLLSRLMLRPSFGPHGGMVQFDHPLCFVHGGVRMLKKLSGSLPIVGKDGDAQAGTKWIWLAAQLERLIQGGLKLIGQDAGIGRIPQVCHENDELISPNSGYRVHLAGMFLKPQCHLFEGGIAYFVTKFVIHRLKSIEVKVQDPDAVAVTAGRGDRNGESVVKKDAISKAGEAIHVNQAVEPELILVM